MTRKAIVAAIGDSWIDLLSLDEVEKAHDDSCGGGGASCGSSGCGCRVSGRPFRAAVPGNMTIKTGDTVEVSASASRAAGASALVLGIPVLSAVAGWISANNLLPTTSETVKAGMTAFCFTAAAGLIFLLGSRRKTSRLPEITSVQG